MKARCIMHFPLKNQRQPYLTDGKEYEVVKDEGEIFEMFDDSGCLLYVLWEGSCHGVFEKVEEGK